MAKETARRLGMGLWTPPQISVNGLKILGTVLLGLYFFSATVVQNGILSVSQYSTDQLNALLAQDGRAMLWAGIGAITSVIGIMGVPVIAYLLVQGVTHTSSMKRYFLRVLIFAVISEIPYDLAMFGKVWCFTEQNSLFTVLIALAMLWLMEKFQGKGTVPAVLNLLFVAAGCFWAVLLHTKFGAGFVLITAVLYLLRQRKAVSYWLGALVSLIYATAPLGFVPVAMCSGERKETGKWGKYGYYVLYPLLLAVFAFLTRFAAGR